MTISKMKLLRHLLVALIISLAPFLTALVGALLTGKGVFDEGEGMGGFIWLTFLSVPLAMLYLMLSASYLLASNFKRRKKKLNE